ncbi:MAG: heparan-alpha-glucosaminide N-acetyltransferase [Pseudomonadota bacterium]
MPTGRILWVDMARTLALICMVVFHIVTDLALFGHIPPHTPVTGGWAVFSRLIAGSFLFLAGLSLVLAHGAHISWRSYWRRLATILGAAGLVTLATWIAIPDTFVYFGILHSIAAAGIVGLCFLRAPVWLTIMAAGFIYVAPDLLRDDVFNGPWLLWLGLGTEVRPTIDYEPVLPWLAPALMGIVAGRLAVTCDLWQRMPLPPPGSAVLAWPGRNSLAIYLIHQPVLIAIIWAGTQVLG